MGRLRVTIACLLFTLPLLEMRSVAQAAVLSTVPVFPHISSTQKWDDFQVLVTVEAPKQEPRLPVHLVFVHSVSNVEVLNEVKNAVEFIRVHLLGTGKEDRVTIVGPSDNGEDHVIHEVSAEVTSTKEITVFKAHSDGSKFKILLEKATWTVKQSQHAGAIILLTDGKSLHDEVVDWVVGKTGCNYPVHTFGLGANHDHEKLRRIASASVGGTYSFVDEENAKMISAALAVCVGGLKNVVVPATSKLKLEAAAGVEIKRIRYGQYNAITTQSSTAGDQNVVKIGMLHTGETKKIVVHLAVQPEGDAPRDGGGCGGRTLLTASFFRGAGDAAPAASKAVCVERRPPGAPAVQTAPSPLVLQEVVRYNLLDVVHQISVSSSTTTATTTSIATVLEEKLDVFVQTHQYWSGIDVVLGGLQKEIHDMKAYAVAASSSSSGSAAATAYIHSWMSSYETQRATAMGARSYFGSTFATQEVSTTVQVATQIIESNISLGSCNGICQEEDYCLEQVTEVIMKALRETKRWKECGSKPADGYYLTPNGPLTD
ncbi:hypothetical protein ACP4OV_027087 [Aristida adscensionis]